MLQQIPLRLARAPEHPGGSLSHGYDIVAPLDATGHLDVEAWRLHLKWMFTTEKARTKMSPAKGIITVSRN